MQTFNKSLIASILVFILPTAFLGYMWWINGREGEDLWFYLLAGWFVLYAAFELYKGVRGRNKK